MGRHKPKVCPEPGCPNLDCEEHRREPWRGSEERKQGRLTGAPERARRARIMYAHRGVCHVCHLPGADQIDHITPLAWGGADDESNLAPIHAEPCHKAKTARESAEGRRRNRAGG